MRDLLMAIAEHQKHCTANTCCLEDLKYQLEKDAGRWDADQVD